MRHRIQRRKLRGTPTHARAMFSNMLISLIEHRRIQSTEPRVRMLRSMAEREVTRFTSLGDLLLKDRTKLSPEDRARLVHAVRLVRRRIRDRRAVMLLCDEIAPRYLGRPGGYTRMYKIGFRKGDGAPVAILEFVDAPMPEREGAPAPSAGAKKKGLLGRLRREKNEKAEKQQ